MKIKLRHVSGGTDREVDMPPDATLKDLKVSLADVYDSSTLKFCFRGGFLSDDTATLSGLGVTAGKTLVVVGTKAVLRTTVGAPMTAPEILQMLNKPSSATFAIGAMERNRHMCGDEDLQMRLWELINAAATVPEERVRLARLLIGHTPHPTLVPLLRPETFLDPSIAEILPHAVTFLASGMLWSALNGAQVVGAMERRMSEVLQGVALPEGITLRRDVFLHVAIARLLPSAAVAVVNGLVVGRDDVAAVLMELVKGNVFSVIHATAWPVPANVARAAHSLFPTSSSSQIDIAKIMTKYLTGVSDSPTCSAWMETVASVLRAHTDMPPIIILLGAQIRDFLFQSVSSKKAKKSLLDAIAEFFGGIDIAAFDTVTFTSMLDVTTDPVAPSATVLKILTTAPPLPLLQCCVSYLARTKSVVGPSEVLTALRATFPAVKCVQEYFQKTLTVEDVAAVMTEECALDDEPFTETHCLTLCASYVRFGTWHAHYANRVAKGASSPTPLWKRVLGIALQRDPVTLMESDDVASAVSSGSPEDVELLWGMYSHRHGVLTVARAITAMAAVEGIALPTPPDCARRVALFLSVSGDTAFTSLSKVAKAVVIIGVATRNGDTQSSMLCAVHNVLVRITDVSSVSIPLVHFLVDVATGSYLPSTVSDTQRTAQACVVILVESSMPYLLTKWEAVEDAPCLEEGWATLVAARVRSHRASAQSAAEAERDRTLRALKGQMKAEQVAAESRRAAEQVLRDDTERRKKEVECLSRKVQRRAEEEWKAEAAKVRETEMKSQRDADAAKAAMEKAERKRRMAEDQKYAERRDHSAAFARLHAEFEENDVTGAARILSVIAAWADLRVMAPEDAATCYLAGEDARENVADEDDLDNVLVENFWCTQNRRFRLPAAISGPRSNIPEHVGKVMDLFNFVLFPDVPRLPAEHVVSELCRVLPEGVDAEAVVWKTAECGIVVHEADSEFLRLTPLGYLHFRRKWRRET